MLLAVLSILPRLCRPFMLPLCMAALLALQGCGGGGDGGGGGGGGGTDEQGAVYFDAPFTASSQLADQCTDLRQKQFIRSYLNEVYLWPERVQRRDAMAYPDARAYFDDILAPVDIDRFSFSLTQAQADAQESAISFDPGIHWANTGSPVAPVWRVTRVDPGSPADTAGIQRGDTLVGSVQTNLDSALGPYFYNFTYLRNGQLTAAALVPTTIDEDPVGALSQIDTNTRRVGYLRFDAHFGNAQDQLIQQLRTAQQTGVNELVLDIRYNGGGYLHIAGSLASMLAPRQTVSQEPVFVELLQNTQQQINSGRSLLRLSPYVLYTDEYPIYSSGSLLPNLNLSRVYLLTTGSTCSASESLINGLRGVGVTVHVIGDTTCGKPYAMSRRDNCGAAYYPVLARGVNAQGWGEFQNGFEPTCRVMDDLDHQLGDPQEAQLNAALVHIQSGACPVGAVGTGRSVARAQMSATPLASDLEPPRRERPAHALVMPR
jgi:carboxyl-terminal processing protease